MVPSCSPWVRYFLCKLLSENKPKTTSLRSSIFLYTDSEHSLGGPIDSSWPLLNKLKWEASRSTSHVCEILITSKSLMMWQWTELLWSLRCRQNRVVCTVDGWVGHWRVHNCGATQFLVSVTALTCPLFSVMRKCTRSRMYLLKGIVHNFFLYHSNLIFW